jgi:hypothetical protein
VINRDYTQGMGMELKRLAGVYGKYEKELAQARATESQRAEAENLMRIWEQVRKAVENPDADCHALWPVYRASFDLPKKSADCIARMMLNNVFDK